MSTAPLVFLVVLLMAGSLWLRRIPDGPTAAKHATVLSGAAVVGALFLAISSGFPVPAGALWENLSPPLVGVVMVSLFVLCLGAPRSEVYGAKLSLGFGLAAAFAGVCLANTTRSLALFVLLSSLPLLPRRRAVILPILGSIAMAIGLLWLAAAGESALPVAGAAPPGALALVWAGAWMRIGLWPFHGWVPVLFERSRPVLSVMAIVAGPGVAVIVRVCIDATWMSTSAGTVLLALAAFSALYGAFLSLGQRELLRTAGWQSVACSGLIVTGLCSRVPQGSAGAMLHVAASGLYLTGFVTVAWVLRARLGKSPGLSTPGVGRDARHLAAAFLLFGLAAAGFPGTLGFVSEDLLLHGVIEHRPVIGAMMVLATALSAIAMLRLFFRVFMGQSERPRGSIVDLFVREKAAFGILLVLLFGLGVLPGPWVRVLSQTLHLHEKRAAEVVAPDNEAIATAAHAGD